MSISLKQESKLLARHSLVYGFGIMLNNVAAFLLLPVYTQYLTPKDYGMKELVGLSTDVIGILVATAISSAMYRFYFESDDEQARREVISTSIIVVGFFGLVTVTVLSFLTRPMARLILDSADLYMFFVISFAAMWFQSMVNIGYDYLRARQKSLLFITLSFGKLLLAIALNIYLIIYRQMGVMGVFVSTLITSIISSIVLIIPILAKTGIHFSLSKTREMLKFGWPLVVSQLGAFVVHLSDRFFLKAYTSIADTGLYSLAHRFGAIPSNFISGPFNQVWQPRRFELYKHQDSERVFGIIFTYFLLVMYFAGLGVSILTREILMIMSDPKFWPAYKIVPIIVIATTIFTFHYHFNMGILISKKTKYLAYINFSNGVLILLLNVLLIRKYGVYGAAIAALLAYIYKVTLTYYFASKYYKIYFEFGRIAKLTVVAIMVYIVSLYITFSSLYVNFAVKSILILAYPLFLYLARFFTKEEKAKALVFLKTRLGKSGNQL
jgi:O-antigen/teichoic acid export membrane protein